MIPVGSRRAAGALRWAVTWSRGPAAWRARPPVPVAPCAGAGGCRRLAHAWLGTLILLAAAVGVLATARIVLMDGVGTGTVWLALLATLVQLSAGAAAAGVAASAAAERDAIEERDHDVLSALLAVEGGLRALRSAPPAATRSAVTGTPATELLDALAVELSTARGLLAAPARTGDAEPFDVADLLRTLANGERLRGARIDVDVPDGLVAAGSAERTARAVRNLLHNARRHAPGAHVEVSGWRDGDRIHVRVHDHGPGIPPAERQHVFERRRRASTAGTEGSGLGLFVARRLMDDQHGGLVLDDGDRGTAFVLTLPAPAARAEVA